MPRVQGWCMVIGCVLIPPGRLGAQGLELRWTGDELKFAAPKLSFLKVGGLLDRLHSGAPVPLDMHLVVAADTRDNIIKRLSERMVLSYDIWEESIAVTPRNKGLPRTMHKTAAGAESACFRALGLKTSDLPPGRQLWFKVEVRPDLSDEQPTMKGTTLGGLVNILSRPNPLPKPELKWVAERGPVTLEELRRLGSNGVP